MGLVPSKHKVVKTNKIKYILIDGGVLIQNRPFEDFIFHPICTLYANNSGIMNARSLVTSSVVQLVNTCRSPQTLCSTKRRENASRLVTRMKISDNNHHYVLM